MEIIKTVNGTELTLQVIGRLDTSTSPALESELCGSIEGVTDLILDFEGLEYVSSAGLRVILTAQKTMNRNQGKMIVKNVNQDIKEVFEITGFCDILTIE